MGFRVLGTLSTVGILSNIPYSGGYRGVAMVSAETPLKERAPLIRDDWYREEQKSP